MNDGLIVNRLEPVHELERDVVSLLAAEPPARANQLSELDPLDELHRDEPYGLCLAVIKNAADVPVGHAAGQLDFREEALRHRWVVERLLPQDLDGDRFVQRSIVRLVHDTHPPFAGATRGSRSDWRGWPPARR